jgi:hypothetical protein
MIRFTMEAKTEQELKKLDDHRHGGPFDRGAADSYYRRGRYPHYYAGGTHASAKIEPEEGSPEWAAYMAGYEYNERVGDKKDWR